MIEIKEITEDNFYEVIKVTVKPSQEEYVSPVTKSLAECWLYREAGDVFPYAIVDGDCVVGFVLIDIDEEEHKFMIWRIQIDQNHQGKGYGTKAIRKIIEMAKENAKINHIIADYVVGNQPMKILLEKLGFAESGRDEVHREIIMRLEIKDQ